MEQPEEQSQDQPQELPSITVPTEEAEAEEETQPTRTVKNFWERLDEVFNQNTDMKERFDELLQQFPEYQRTNGEFKSFLFQPERLALCSNDDIQPYSQATNVQGTNVPKSSQGHRPSEQFNSFRIRLKRPLRNVKSIQLLSAVIPNATQNIPDTNVFFAYYRLRSVAQANQGAWLNNFAYGFADIVSYLGANYVSLDAPNQGNLPTDATKWLSITLPGDQSRPNYYDLHWSQIQTLLLTPTYQWMYEYTPAGNENFFNRTFVDYQDLVNALNFVAAANNRNNSISDDVSFQYNETLNKIIFIPSPDRILEGYYYLPVGFGDKNLTQYFQSGFVFNIDQVITFLQDYDTIPEGILNYRLGHTWNGVFTDPYLSTNPWNDVTFLGQIYWYMRAKDPGYTVPLYPFLQDVLTFNSYPDLVNTSCVRLYADFTLASTQDSLDSSSSNAQQGLLSIIPVNTTNLGVSFYQNNFNNELTKIPQNITEINITMLNDQGQPFNLPNSATVLLELGLTYH